MSTTGELVAPGGGQLVVAEHGALEPHAHVHPQPRQYVMIAVVLVVITGIEVAVSYLDSLNTNVMIVLLLMLAVTKFALVVAWYMHLKTDSKLLRRFFIVGLVGAMLLFTVVALTLHALQNDYNVHRG